MPHTDILIAAISVMKKTASDARQPIMQELFEEIEHEARMSGPATPPAGNAAG